MPSPSPSPTPEPPDSDFRRYAAILIAVAAGLHGAALWNSTPLQSANDRSRWSTVWALVEQGSFAIEAIDGVSGWTTIDKVQHEGHLYSTKPALLTVIAAEVYRAIRATLGWSIAKDTRAVTRLVLVCINLLPWLAALFALAALAERMARTTFARSFLLAAAAFGTYLSTYSVTFNNHTVAAVSLIFALYFAFRIIAEGSRSWWHFALCGVASAFVTTNELPAAAFGLAIFAMLLRYDWRRTLFAFGPAAAVVIAAFLATTWFQTGSWKPFYLAYGTEKYVYIRDGVPSYWAEPKGLDRNLDSPAAYLLHCLVGHHGILSLSPVFLLTVVTWVRMGRRPRESYRPLLWLGLAMTVLILTFYLSRTENYNYGGNTVALRWALWLVPFWLLALVPTLDDFSYCRRFRLVAGLLLAVSVFSAWEAIGNPWRPSWLYSRMEAAGWIDYRDRPPALPRRVTTWFPTLPAAAASASEQWIELTAAGEKGPEWLRLELVSSDEDEVVVRLTVSESSGESVTATIDRSSFVAGAPPEEFVVAGEPSPAVATRALRRLPASVEYRQGPVRYLKSPLRELAFRTQHAAAVVDVRRRSGTIVRHRVEAWLCPDVPFGVVRLRETLTNATTGEWISRRDYELTAAGRMEEPEWARAIRDRTRSAAE